MFFNLKEFKCIHLIGILFFLSRFVALADNPLVPDVGMADPHIYIFNNKAYMYATRDSDNTAKQFVMPEWKIWSSTDLINWTLETTIKPAETYMGKSNSCWATDIAFRNDRYYFYFSNGNKNTGVMIGSEPAGPFTDALGKPLLNEALTPGKEYDPTVFTDDDGICYIIFGHFRADEAPLKFYISRLNNDMVSLAESPKVTEISGNVPVLSGNDKPTLHKRNGIYYLSAGTHYATSTNIYGPYIRTGDSGNGKFGLDSRAHGNYFTWNGQWFHTWCHFYLGKDIARYRESYITYLHFKENGEMVDDVAFLDAHFATGVGQYDAGWEKIEAEWFMRASEITKKELVNTGFAVSDIENNDYLIYPNIKGLSKVKSVEFLVSVNKNATIEIRKDSPEGELLSRCGLKAAKTEADYECFTCDLPPMDDILNLCFVFKGKDKQLLQFNSFRFIPKHKNGLTLYDIEDFKKIKEAFKNPPRQYKPVPFWHINDTMTTAGIRQQMKDASDAGFTGVTLLPLVSSGNKKGTSPQYLSEGYFDRFQDLLDVAGELEMEVILYDDNDFPSGMAGGKLEKEFPESTMKRLDKIEHEISGPALFTDTVKAIKLMAAVAMNTKSLQRIEISRFVKNDIITWQVPAGTWKIMLFPMVKDSFHKKYLCVDFMDTTAVRHLIDLTYDAYAKRFGRYFGNTIKMTFFDDVGFWRHPYNWTGTFNEKFKELNGYDPEPYYPVLWYNIGPETEAIRNAFFKTRAELLAEGYPRLVAEWNAKHGLKSTGHPPGNYDPTPIDMNGDIFKFYRYSQVPLMDAIISYQFGQNGHKLISSAADYYDRPVVSTEVYGAFREVSFDSMMLYRPVMELFARGVNFVIPHGMWYDPAHVYIQPLVSPYSEKLKPALPAYSEFVGRSCMLLQGGRKVSEIGVMYPFEELAGWFRFDNPPGIRQGFNVSPETDYQKISSLLTNEIRRDFTFVHPEFFLEEKYKVGKGVVQLNNRENFQAYKTMIISGCNTISYKTLEKLKAFYDNGGTLISTTKLPHKSSELGADEKVLSLVKEIFGANPFETDSVSLVTKENSKGGKAIYIPRPSKETLQAALSAIPADVQFEPNPVSVEFGKLSYIHKIKDGKHIFFFANSSNGEINTEVLLRGKLNIESWNPHNGIVSGPGKVTYITKNGQTYTRCRLTLKGVQSVFWMGN